MGARGKHTHGAIASLIAVISLVGSPAALAQETAPTTGRDTLLTGIYSDEWHAGRDLTALSSATPTPLSFAGTFHTLRESEDGWGPGATDRLLEQVWSAKVTPVANVNVRHSAYQVARGDADSDIIAWSRRVRAWLDRGGGRSLLIAPMQEMNGNWVPYGMDPGNYRIAFRRFVQLARSEGLDETVVRWVFAPNGWSVPPHSMADYYPGDDIVDIVGVSAYNFGALVDFWTPVEWAISAVLREVETFAPDKPYILAQVGSSTAGGDRDAWLAEMFRVGIRHPNVVGLVYFNFDKETDWKIWRDHQVAAGWFDGHDQPAVRHIWPLTGWFQPGPLLFKPYEGRFADDDLLPIRDDIDWLAELGVIAGCDDRSFCPDGIVTRGQLAVLLSRALGLVPADSDRFVDDDGSNYQAQIEAVVNRGLLDGCDSKRFCPNAPATRDDLKGALAAAGTPSEQEFTPTPDLAKFPPICPTARYCQKKSLTRTYAAAAIGAFLRTRPLEEPHPEGPAPTEPAGPSPWWVPPVESVSFPR
ncbi:MAG: S-layer homology domain-containing protein [Acidimicrobiia bacterium]|nr:S-layer homology domain-containing protein [Acidimicrobiia bacterium]